MIVRINDANEHAIQEIRNRLAIEAAARKLLEARKPIVCRKNRKGHDFTHTAGEFPFRRFCGYCGTYYDKAEHSEEQRKKREDAAARELAAALAGKDGGE